jgi:hypothetical protein
MVTVTVGFFFGLVLSYRGLQSYRRYTLLKNTATETVRAAALGQTKLHGTVQAAGSVADQPVTDAACVYAAWQFQPQSRERDSGVVTRRSQESGQTAVPFYLDGDEGRVLVDAPTDATVTTEDEESWVFTDRGVTETLLLSAGQGSVDTLLLATGQELFGPPEREKTITTGTELYVFGQLTECENPPDEIEDAEYILERDDRSGQFILSDRSDLGLESRLKSLSRMQIVSGILISAYCLGYWSWVVLQRGLSPVLEATAYGAVICGILVGPYLLLAYLFRERW